MAKVVDRQIFASIVTVSVSQLLQMAPNLVPFVQAQFNQVPILASANQGPMVNGNSGEPSSFSAEVVYAVAIDVNRQLPILPMTIGTGTFNFWFQDLLINISECNNRSKFMDTIYRS